MEIKKSINIICLIAGFAVILFGAVARMGMIENVEPGRGIVPILLGVIIALWSLISMRRNR